VETAAQRDRVAMAAMNASSGNGHERAIRKWARHEATPADEPFTGFTVNGR
jgi:hypothetical protein